MKFSKIEIIIFNKILVCIYTARDKLVLIFQCDAIFGLIIRNLHNLNREANIPIKNTIKLVGYSHIIGRFTTYNIV